jgi:hypothetical protein
VLFINEPVSTSCAMSLSKKKGNLAGKRSGSDYSKHGANKHISVFEDYGCNETHHIPTYK